MVSETLSRVMAEKKDMLDILFDILEECIAINDMDGIEQLTQMIKVESDSLYYHLDEMLSYLSRRGDSYGNN